MKTRITVIVAALFVLAFSAEAKTPELKFDKEGNFKIVMLTDLHLCVEKPARPHIRF